MNHYTLFPLHPPLMNLEYRPLPEDAVQLPSLAESSSGLTVVKLVRYAGALLLLLLLYCYCYCYCYYYYYYYCYYFYYYYYY